jgi:hypothetical protein
MIGMIRPLVQEAKTPWRWLGLLGIYALGAIGSALLLGLLLGMLGAALIPGNRSWLVLIGVALLGLLMAAGDFQIGGLRTCTLRRQTRRIWWDVFGPGGAMLLWGLDLGLGFTTIRVASLYWVVACVVIALASPQIGALVLGAYGLAIVLNLGASLLLLKEEESGGSAIRAVQWQAPVKTCLAVILLIWSILLLILSIKEGFYGL